MQKVTIISGPYQGRSGMYNNQIHGEWHSIQDGMMQLQVRDIDFVPIV